MDASVLCYSLDHSQPIGMPMQSMQSGVCCSGADSCSKVLPLCTLYGFPENMARSLPESLCVQAIERIFYVVEKMYGIRVASAHGSEEVRTRVARMKMSYSKHVASKYPQMASRGSGVLTSRDIFGVSLKKLHLSSPQSKRKEMITKVAKTHAGTIQ